MRVFMADRTEKMHRFLTPGSKLPGVQNDTKGVAVACPLSRFYAQVVFMPRWCTKKRMKPIPPRESNPVACVETV
jgi:hypothetical protein